MYNSSSYTDSPWKHQFGYSIMLKDRFGMELPYEQYGLYLAGIGGSLALGSNIIKALNVAEAARHAVGSDQRRLLTFAAGATEEQIGNAAFLSRSLIERGFLLGLGYPVLFSVFVYINNSNKRQLFSDRN